MIAAAWYVFSWDGNTIVLRAGVLQILPVCAWRQGWTRVPPPATAENQDHFPLLGGTRGLHQEVPDLAKDKAFWGWNAHRETCVHYEPTKILGRKAVINLDSAFRSRDITLLAEVCLVKTMALLVVMYGYERWTIKKVECWRIDAFELWCWSRLLRVPWTARRSNQSILKEISPEYS